MKDNECMFRACLNGGLSLFDLAIATQIRGFVIYVRGFLSPLSLFVTIT